MSLPVELTRLPPQALDLLRYLGTCDRAMSVEEIMDGTGFSERGFRKWIRRLVTRYFAAMPATDYYELTPKGHQAAESLREFDGADPAAATGVAAESTFDSDEDADADSGAVPVLAAAQKDNFHPRQLAVMIPKELVQRSETVLRAGLGGPTANGAPLIQPGRVVLRVSAPGCDVKPVERPLDVDMGGPAGPVEFLLVPRKTGTARIKIEMYQYVTMQDRRLMGGIYFDLNVAGFPTPASGDMQALGANVELHPGIVD
ncbi:MAG: hypothetical protein JXQ72_02215 [Anaerolineae bacterium]|nr:hypothetical protein [Anaerolineae bacterium]